MLSNGFSNNDISRKLHSCANLKTYFYLKSLRTTKLHIKSVIRLIAYVSILCIPKALIFAFNLPNAGGSKIVTS